MNRRHFLSAAALSGAALAAPAVLHAKRTESGDIRLLGEILHVADTGQSKSYVVMEELKETLALSIPR